VVAPRPCSTDIRQLARVGRCAPPMLSDQTANATAILRGSHEVAKAASRCLIVDQRLQRLSPSGCRWGGGGRYDSVGSPPCSDRIQVCDSGIVPVLYHAADYAFRALRQHRLARGSPSVDLWRRLSDSKARYACRTSCGDSKLRAVVTRRPRRCDPHVTSTERRLRLYAKSGKEQVHDHVQLRLQP